MQDCGLKVEARQDSNDTGLSRLTHLVKMIVGQERRRPDVERPLKDRGLGQSLSGFRATSPPYLLQSERDRKGQHRVRDQTKSRGGSPSVSGDILVGSGQERVVEGRLQKETKISSDSMPSSIRRDSPIRSDC